MDKVQKPSNYENYEKNFDFSSLQIWLSQEVKYGCSYNKMAGNSE
jgi:hypothetical protein